MPKGRKRAAIQFHYGAGSLSRLPRLVRRMTPGRSLLLIVDPGIASIGERAEALLEASGLRTTSFADFSGDPRSRQIEAAAQAARAAGAEAVIAIGGGSALDIAKLAAAVAGAEQPVESYALCRAPLPAKGLPCLLVPTTAGTGSEATRTAVFTTEAGAKVWAWGDELRADQVLLDPELTLGLPRQVTVATGLDALVHAMEAVTSRRGGRASRALGLQAVRMAREALPQAAEAPGNLEARARLLVAAWLAGRAIDLAGTGIAHALGHALGEVAGLHHGRAVALGLKVALPRNVRAAPEAYAAIGRAFGLEGSEDEAVAEELPLAFAQFLEKLGLDQQLPEGLSLERLLLTVQREENQPMLQANCHSYSQPELRALLEALLPSPA